MIELSAHQALKTAIQIGSVISMTETPTTFKIETV